MTTPRSRPARRPRAAGEAPTPTTMIRTSVASALIALSAAGGCGGPPSSNGESTQYPQPRFAPHVALSSADSGALQLGEHGNANLVTLPVDRAWGALVNVYQALGVEVTQVDPAGHALAGRRLRSHRPFAGQPLATLISCGETAGIANASRWDINLQLATKLLPDGPDHTIVATWVLASGKPGATAGDEINCMPNDRIAAIVAGAVQQAAR